MLYNIKFFEPSRCSNQTGSLTQHVASLQRHLPLPLLYIGIARHGLYTPHEDLNMFTAIGTHYRRIIEESWEDKNPISPDFGLFI